MTTGTPAGLGHPTQKATRISSSIILDTKSGHHVFHNRKYRVLSPLLCIQAVWSYCTLFTLLPRIRTPSVTRNHRLKLPRPSHQDQAYKFSHFVTESAICELETTPGGISFSQWHAQPHSTAQEEASLPCCWLLLKKMLSPLSEQQDLCAHPKMWAFLKFPVKFQSSSIESATTIINPSCCVVLK